MLKIAEKPVNMSVPKSGGEGLGRATQTAGKRTSTACTKAMAATEARGDAGGDLPPVGCVANNMTLDEPSVTVTKVRAGQPYTATEHAHWRAT